MTTPNIAKNFVLLLRSLNIRIPAKKLMNTLERRSTVMIEINASESLTAKK